MLTRQISSNAIVILQGKTDTLVSYGTLICTFDGKTFKKLWNGYTKTTMKHINQFLEIYGLEKLNKKAWENLPCEEE